MIGSEFYDLPLSIIIPSVICICIYIIGGMWLTGKEEELEEKKLKSKYDLLFGIMLIIVFLSIKSLLELIGFV